MVQDAATREQALSYVRHQAAKSLADLAALMERTGADCGRCLEGMSEEQAGFKYDEEWCIKEVVGHMLTSSKDINREIAKMAARKAATRVGRVGVTSGGDRPVGELRSALADLWTETGRLVASLPEEGSLEATREHPWFGHFNFREWIAFQRLHAMDHLQQMEKVKAHPGYPKG